MEMEEVEALLECNSCSIGLHSDCCLENNKYLADDISDPNKSLFCDHCEENVSEDGNND
jgi:hypothetical protein